MESSFARTERTYVRLIVAAAGGLILFVLACVGGNRAYQHWQEEHLVRRATAFMSGGDLRTASVTVRRALQLNPENAAANRLLASIAEKAADRSALDLRRKVFEANPNSIDDAVALVRTALRYDDLATAEKTLSRIAAIAQNDAQFHAASGRLAQMKNDISAAETHWVRAAELAPNDSAYRFQLALVRLGSTDAAKRNEGRAALEQLRADPAQRAPATRTLLIDAIAQHDDVQRSRSLASELQGYAEATFSDRVMYLEILRQLRDAEFEAYLAQMKKDAAATVADSAALLSWMLRKQSPQDTLEFAATLPASLTAEWPMPRVLAEARAQAQEWVGLEAQLRSSQWPQSDFLRHAFLARALRGEDKKLEAEQELSFARKEAESDANRLSSLLQTIASWGWENEAVEMLWVLTKNPETKISALRTLYEHYVKAADSAGLYRTLSKLAEVNPSDLALQNNLAQVSLLIGVEPERATKLAADANAKDPSNASFASTYAFALLSKGDVAGALNVMDRLSSNQLREPAASTYYGIILAAAGKKDKAREFLGRSAETTLLPEEKALVEKAQATIQ
ncbi:MAG TPA: hypothetical protein VGC85_11660 [Chthoniobacterales bacterium]